MLIDYVLPYFDKYNINWKSDYFKYTNTPPNRVRDNEDALKYHLRTLEKHLTFINNIYLIVADKSQVPTWIDKTKIKIVYHKDFIPNELLPTFNLYTIEMFLFKIHGLSQFFIYGSLSNIYTHTLKDKFYFSENGIKTKIITEDISKKEKTLEDYININSSNIIYNNEENTATYKSVMPSEIPLIKSLCSECFDANRQKILDSCTKLPDKKNLNISLFTHYLNVNGHVVNEFHNSLIVNNNSTAAKQTIDSAFSKNIRSIHVPVPKGKENFFYAIHKLSKLYTTKSKYELCDKEDIPVDFVFPYVTMNDPIWQKKYIENLPKEKISSWAVGEKRFRDPGTLKYLFRMIEKNLPWVNKVHMIVDCPSQVPDWLDTSKVSIICHKDFIPNEELPVFNSSHFEMFLGDLPNVSEYFIYGNDDMFPFQPLSKEDFFEHGFMKYKWKIRKWNTRAPGDPLRNRAYNIIHNTNQKEKVVELQHSITPIRKSLYKECFNLHKKEILKSLSKFREDKNFNQYLFTYYIAKYYDVLNTSHKSKNCEITYASIFNPWTYTDNKVLCINDNENPFSERNWDFVINIFETLFKEKSKYEIEKE